MFDQKKAEAYLQQELKWYGIKVIEWSKSSCGKAWYQTKKIKIPKPTDIDRFAVCMHEIKHIIDGRIKTTFEREFICDMYALDKIRELGFEDGAEEWIKRTKWHILHKIAKAFNRGLKIKNISKQIRDFFPEIDFNTWQFKSVYVGADKEWNLNIILVNTLPREEVETLLGRKGMIMEKSQTDDSSYGKWMVKSNGEPYGTAFNNLTEIVTYYDLAL